MAHSPAKIALALELRRMGKSLKEISEQTCIPRRTLNNILNHKGNARILIISDAHCGHRAGLTPPKWQYGPHTKWGRLQKEVWEWFQRTVENLQPITHCFVLGDMLDGRGERSGSTELITTDRLEQVEMAAEVLATVKASVYTMVYGTGYHTGDKEDWESILAYRLPSHHQCKIVLGSHEQIKVNGFVFDLKHKISSSTIPHGRFTALAKAKLWNREWAEREGQAKADVFLRGHVHYFDFCGDNTFLAFCLPALQTWGSKFGERQCEGVVNTGLLWMDIPYHANRISDIDWHEVIEVFEHQHMVLPDYDHREPSG